MQQRWFQRVLFTVKCMVTLDDVIIKGQIENISLNGALISFGKDTIVNHGDKCFLTIYLEDQSELIRIDAEVVRFLHNMVGIKFGALDPDTQSGLYEMVNRMTTMSEKQKYESDRMRGHLADYLMPTNSAKYQ